MMTTVRIRISRDHYLNGRRRQSGAVLRVDRTTAEWLVKMRRAQWLDAADKPKKNK